jgi:hypothetical protein
MVVCRRGPEVVDPRGHELCGLQRVGAVEHDDLVEAPLGRALGGGPVVADDGIDEGVVEHTELLDRVDESPDVVVGVLEEPGIHLHLAGEHGLQVVGHVDPGRDLLRSGGELRLGRHDAELLLAAQDLLPQGVPPGVELTSVPVRPLDRDMVRRMGRAGRVVDEERAVRHERLLLAHPVDGVVGHVVGEVVALLRAAVGLDRDGVAVDRGGVLVGLAADEPVEVLEPAATRRPVVERPHRAGLPHRDLVTLAELGCRVPVQLQRLREWRAALRAQRGVSRR